MSSLRIRPLRGTDEFLQCERLQQKVWGTVSLSAEVLLVMQGFGGLVLGAMEGERLVGFICALLAEYEGRKVHWSFQMAVREGRRDRGLGFRMKLAHRRIALERGIRSVCWTYDPLQSRNALLNIRRLGAKVRAYKKDFYGYFPSSIEQGLPADRLIVEWRIGSREVERHLIKKPKGKPKGKKRREAEKIPASAPLANETERQPNGFLRNRRIRTALRSAALRIEIPSDTDRMRRRDPALALHWRLQTRKLFLFYLARGYLVKDFLVVGDGADRRCFYLLGK